MQKTFSILKADLSDGDRWMEPPGRSPYASDSEAGTPRSPAHKAHPRAQFYEPDLLTAQGPESPIGPGVPVSSTRPFSQAWQAGNLQYSGEQNSPGALLLV